MNRETCIPLAAVFAVMAATTMPVPFQKEIALHWNLDERGRALFVSLPMLGMFVGSPAAGSLYDTVRSKRLLFILSAWACSACFLWMIFAQSTAELLTARLLEGALFAFVISPLLASAGERFMHAAGLLLALGAALGMPLGGLFAKPEHAFAMSGLLMAAGSLASPSLFTRAAGRPGFDLIKRIPILLVPAGFAFLDRFIAGFMTGPFLWRLRSDLGLDAPTAGRLLACVMLPMALLSVPAAVAARKISPVVLVAAGSVLYAAAAALASHSNSVPQITGLLLAAGFGAGMLYVPSMILAVRLSPADLRNTAMAFYVGAGSLGFMLGPVIPAELEKARAGTAQGTAVVVCSVVCAASFLLFFLRGRLAAAENKSAVGLDNSV